MHLLKLNFICPTFGVHFNSEDLTKAFLEGARTARESVVRPVEGTILTVSMESITIIPAIAKEMAEIIINFKINVL